MALTRAQMSRLDVLLAQALDLDRAGRERWLLELGAADRDLEPALRRALQGAADPDALATLPKFEAPSLHAPGDLIGPYRLMRPLGTGGMAQVWLAQRADGAYQREVALKIPGIRERGDLEERFFVERDILAHLEHPQVARFYDAGVAQDGQPYLALEYVPGKDLLAWADERALGILPRIELFLQVLEAVAYAHRKGVLHRDIKPSNVLVTEAGEVRLLDFGVAKLLQHKSHLTEVYGRALTPAYASPEQLRGFELTPASDIYSLGVMLYELLCGVRPGEPGQAAATGPSPPPAAPSTRIELRTATARSSTPARLQSFLKGDLDAIVLKALAIDTSERYESVGALAEDLRRHLAGRPVRARPDTFAYRAERFVHRHAYAVSAATVVALAFLALAIFSFKRGEAGPPPAAGAAAAGTPSDQSIAVLPFVNMSADKDQEYFADGLTEELIDRLSHSPNLKVVARTSSFYFKGKNDDVRAIGAKLGVARLLEGSVRRYRNDLRITAQLVRTADGTHLWSQTFDRPLAGIFSLQDEIAGRVASLLFAKLGAYSPPRPPSGNLEAYKRWLQGNYFVKRGTRDDSLRAIDLYRNSLALDPGYAAAWTELAFAHYQRAAQGWEPFEEAVKEIDANIDQSLKFDPKQARAHQVRALVAFNFDWNWDAARREYREAAALDPAEPNIACGPTLVDFNFGHFDEAIACQRRIIALSPLETITINNLSGDLFDARRFQEAAEAAREVVTLDPGFAGGHAGLALTLVYLGRLDDALAAAQAEPDESWRLETLPIVYWAMGRRAESDAALKEVETKYADSAAYNIAAAHAYRRESDQAFPWLERAYRQRDGGLQLLVVDPLLDALRTDPRYGELVRRMHLDAGPVPAGGPAR